MLFPGSTGHYIPWLRAPFLYLQNQQCGGRGKDKEKEVLFTPISDTLFSLPLTFQGLMKWNYAHPDDPGFISLLQGP